MSSWLQKISQSTIYFFLFQKRNKCQWRILRITLAVSFGPESRQVTSIVLVVFIVPLHKFSSPFIWIVCIYYGSQFGCTFFSLQPVRDTREKQVQLWKELILDYCKTQKIFVIGLEEDFPLFSNPAIESKDLFINLRVRYFFWLFLRPSYAYVPSEKVVLSAILCPGV